MGTNFKIIKNRDSVRNLQSVWQPLVAILFVLCYYVHYMNKDLTILQDIADTLEDQPMASQRVLAEKAGMSIGLMNAVLKRFVERGWIMLSNVNLKKLSYAITPAGIAELTRRSQSFARRTFEIANTYNEEISRLVLDAKTSGKTSVALYGESYIKFLLVYACQTHGIDFVQKDINSPAEEKALCLIGELNDEEDIDCLEKSGFINLLKLITQ